MSHCAPSEMNTSVSRIPMLGYTTSAMAFLRLCMHTHVLVNFVIVRRLIISCFSQKS